MEVFRVTNGLENSLMAQFARDLGEVFEDHFVRAVALLSSIVAEHNDVSVIEVRLQILKQWLRTDSSSGRSIALHFY